MNNERLHYIKVMGVCLLIAVILLIASIAEFFMA